MDIHITTTVGTGITKLAAFHAALLAAGVAQYNLIRLSSIIPPGSKLKVHKGPIPKLSGGWGDKLYAVYAEQRTDSLYEEAWAGIGWMQRKKTGAGLLVEHEGRSKPQLSQEIKGSTENMMKHHNMKPSECLVSYKIAGLQCRREAVCALAIAVFQIEKWNRQ